MRNAAGTGVALLEGVDRWRLPQKYAPKWRNWQTRYIQDVVPVRAWRFESSLRHQLLGLADRLGNSGKLELEDVPRLIGARGVGNRGLPDERKVAVSEL
jgi:hypothetical protein